MKEEAARANQEIADECNKENGIMAMFFTVVDTLEREENKHQIGQSINDLGSIRGAVIILRTRQPTMPSLDILVGE